MFILAITISTIIMLVMGGWMRGRLQKGGLRFGFAQKSVIRRRLFGFLMFIVAIFLIGWLMERLQATVYALLMQSAATGITGVLFAFGFSYLMYEIFVWRKYNK
jgi:small-conductance mechanosensitive channel